MTFATLAWGAFAYGALHPWAYRPLLVGCTLAGLLGLFFKAAGADRTWPFLLGVALLIVATLCQLLPLPREMILTLSPSADAFLLHLDESYTSAVAASGTATHTLSIDPDATRVGLAFLIALGLLFVGAVRTLTNQTVHQIAAAYVVLGSVLALFGIGQKGLFLESIYGRLGPHEGESPFGPFLNRNHFAGWMLMALPLSMGYLGALASSATRTMKPGWRNRVLWCASRDANRLLVVAFGIFLMALSLLLTTSRSGVVSFGISLLLSASFFLARRSSGLHRTIVAGLLVGCIATASSWADLDAIVARFDAVPGSGLNGRLGLWQDARRVIQDFPLVGSGLNTYGAAMQRYQRFDLRNHYAEAHNDYLQLAAEGGLLLGAPALLLVLLFAWNVGQRFRNGADDPATYFLRAGAVTGVIAVALQEIFEFSLQVPANAATFAILCAVAVQSGRSGVPEGSPDPPAPPRRRRPSHR